MFKNFYSIGEAALLLGVSVVTMRRWAASSQLACTRTLGGHRRFKHDDLFPKENDGLTLLYARVSSRDQVEDLAHQTDTLKAHCTEKHWSNLHTIQDIGSGLNTRKPGLRKLISLVLARKVKRLVIMHKDRLLRFANDLLLDLCRSFGVEVLVLRHEEKKCSGAVVRKHCGNHDRFLQQFVRQALAQKPTRCCRTTCAIAQTKP